jgi:hypothetical protein
LPQSADGGGCQAAPTHHEQRKRLARNTRAAALLDQTTTAALPRDRVHLTHGTCRGALFTSLEAQAMDFLIKSHWYEAEAERLRITPTAAQVNQALRLWELPPRLRRHARREPHGRVRLPFPDMSAILN